MIGRGPQIADAVVAELEDLSQAWNAAGVISVERQWDKTYKPADLTTLRVLVSITEMETGTGNVAKLDRRHVQERYTVVIVMQKRITYQDEQVIVSEVDALDLKAQQISDFFNATGQAGTVTLTAANTTWEVLKAERKDMNMFTEQHHWFTYISLTVQGRI